jgi:hypothetical protein
MKGMAGEPDGNDDVLEFGETDGGRGFRLRGRRFPLVAAGVVLAGAAIAGSAAGVSAATHGAATHGASARTPAARTHLVRTQQAYRYNGLTLQEQSNGVILLPAAARYRGVSSGAVGSTVAVNPPTGHVRCHQTP